MIDGSTIVGLVAAILSFTVAYLTYLRGNRSDAVAAQSRTEAGHAAEKADAAANQGKETDRVISGLNQIVDHLRIDNTQLRTDFADLQKKYRELSDQCEHIEQELDDLKRRDGDVRVTRAE